MWPRQVARKEPNDFLSAIACVVKWAHEACSQNSVRSAHNSAGLSFKTVLSKRYSVCFLRKIALSSPCRKRSPAKGVWQKVTKKVTEASDQVTNKRPKESRKHKKWSNSFGRPPFAAPWSMICSVSLACDLWGRYLWPFSCKCEPVILWLKHPMPGSRMAFPDLLFLAFSVKAKDNHQKKVDFLCSEPLQFLGKERKTLKRARSSLLRKKARTPRKAKEKKIRVGSKQCIGESSRGNAIRGNMIENVWEGDLPLRGSLIGRVFQSF